MTITIRAGSWHDAHATAVVISRALIDDGKTVRQGRSEKTDDGWQIEVRDA